MSLDKIKTTFLRDVASDLLAENVAIFAGAGLSIPAGFVSWKELLKPIAEELGLDIDREHDLVSLAQYHVNENSGNRNQLNQRLINEFAARTKITENHTILARLPIRTYWTTNYDKLIENSLESANKIPDVKYTKEQLAITKPQRDAVVYKMHGDIEHPDSAILIKDDYESYHLKMDQYITALSGDLVSKTFIFIGFSFTDPNLDYILSRVRISYQNSQRRHFCFLRNVSKSKDETEADFQYRIRKQKLFVGDLKRFNIKAVLVDSYSEITEMLRAIEKQYRRNSIFISGAAHDYGNWGAEKAQRFVHELSKELIKHNYKVVSGFGLGIGSAVISGALEQIYMNPGNSSNDQLILRPFPQNVFGLEERKVIWTKYRKDIVAHAGIALFIFGNKLKGGETAKSNGMREEFEISKAMGLSLLPVGTTEFISRDFWNEMQKEIEESSHSDEFKNLFMRLGEDDLQPEELIPIILDMIKKLKQES